MAILPPLMGTASIPITLAVAGVVSGFLLQSAPVLAQITPDDTLGNERSTIRRDVDSGIDVIEGGATRGTNLFHSFEQFNIDANQSVYFDNPASIANILSRVTGNDPSDILGRLGVSGNANLFLLNPSGILFGENASLDIRGSFFATTADALQFGDQGFFSAINPETPPLLTVDPSAFLFSQIQRGDITNRSIAPAGVNPIGQPVSGLRVGEGSTLTLLGGNVNLEGGRINTFGGRAEIGAVAGVGTIALNPDGSLSFPSSVERSDVSLTNGAAINTAAGGEGEIAINARNIHLSGGSTLTTGILAGLGGEGARSGDIRLNATSSVGVRDASQVITSILGQGIAGNIVINAGNHILIEGTGRKTYSRIDSPVLLSRVERGTTGEGGDIRLSAHSIAITNGAGVSASNLGQGNAGSINIQAIDQFSLNESAIATNILGNGQGGDILIFARIFSGNGSQLGSAVLGQGQGGDVVIRVDDRFSLRGTGVLIKNDEQLGRNGVQVVSGIYTVVEKGAIGQGGNIHIFARSVSITNGVAIDASLRGQGDAGNIRLHTRERIFLDEGFVASTVQPEAVGNAGSVHLFTRVLLALNGSALTSSTYGQGRAGDITIHARDFLLLDGTGKRGFSSEISTDSFQAARGQGGNIVINASRFRIANGAVISASTDSSDQGGDITLNVDTFTATNGGQITTSARGRGSAGNINLHATEYVNLSGQDPTFRRRLTQFRNNVLNENNGESGLFANTYAGSTSNGGNIIISASNLEIQDGASVTVDSQGSGEGGNIEMRTGSLVVSNQAQLSAGTSSNNGGNIILEIDNALLLFDRSNITTEAGTQRAGGNGGNINIDAPFIVTIPNEDSNINANAFRGNGGNINIATESILGLQTSEQPTPLSDITASSEFGLSGNVSITTPEVDPSQGLVELPSTIVDASQQIAQTCSANGGESSSEFVVTGRGGLPPDPTQIVGNETIITRLATLDELARIEDSHASSSMQVLREDPSSPASAPPIVEAQGWSVDAEGNVVLIAQAPAVTPNTPGFNSIPCDRS